MSKGSRDSASGILKSSMRDNYGEHGVGEYYKRVGATYRNPHYPGVRSCMFLWLNRWWVLRQPHIDSKVFTVFDLACGSGEVTTALLEWWRLGRAAHTARKKAGKTDRDESDSEDEGAPRVRAAVKRLTPPRIGPELPSPSILASDPFTAQAFHTRTGLYCTPLTFKDIAEGKLPAPADLPVDSPHHDSAAARHAGSLRGSYSSLFSDTESQLGSVSSASSSTKSDTQIMEMVICSFALHLIEKPSELFALLWELSMKTRWLVIIAPHKRPEIKDGWGWCKWDIDTWSETRIHDTVGEFLEERVHCRVYKSLNCD